MRLFKKNDVSGITNLNSMKAIMKWTTAADFDIGAVVEQKSGKYDIVYFGRLLCSGEGYNLSLNKDAGIGDKSGDNEEILTINDSSNLSKIYIMCWDYGAVCSGSRARFDKSDISVTLEYKNGDSDIVKLDSGTKGNFLVIATIDTNSQQVINSSHVEYLKEFPGKLDQLVGIAKSASISVSTSANKQDTFNDFDDFLNNNDYSDLPLELGE